MDTVCLTASWLSARVLLTSLFSQLGPLNSTSSQQIEVSESSMFGLQETVFHETDSGLSIYLKEYTVALGSEG